MNEEIVYCEHCQVAPGTIQAMYPEFDTEYPNLLFWLCEGCAKSPYVVVPTSEELLLIEMGIEVTNPKIERLIQEADEAIQKFVNSLKEKGIDVKRIEEMDPPE
jgi:hypothetical protein